VDDEVPKSKCPKCGALVDDYDGFGVLHHEVCGYCVHPNSTREEGKWICGICGEEISRSIGKKA